MADRELAEDVVREDEAETETETGWVLRDEEMSTKSNITIDMGLIFKQKFGFDIDRMKSALPQRDVDKIIMNLIKFAYILACKFVTVDERQVRDRLLALIVSSDKTPIPVRLDRRARGEQGHVGFQRLTTLLKNMPFATRSNMSLIFVWLCLMKNITDLVARFPEYNHILEELIMSTDVPTGMLADMLEGRRLEVRRGRIIFNDVRNKDAEELLKVAIEEANLGPYEVYVLSLR
jgi:hypothetical protein